MAIERTEPVPFNSSSAETAALAIPRSERELYRQILTSAMLEKPICQRDFMQDAMWYCQLKDIKIESSAVEKPDANLPLVITPNHYSERLFSKTSDAIKDIIVVAVACRDQQLSQNHIAWFVKRLAIYPVGLGMLVRKIQNASVKTYATIPVEAKHGRIGNAKEMAQKYLQARKNGHNIGFFPEQKSTRVLSIYHPVYPRMLKLMRQIFPQGYQILPTSIYDEANTTHIGFGRVIRSESFPDNELLARETMMTLAQNLPPRLRGPWG